MISARTNRLLTYPVLFGFLALCLHGPAVQAGLIGTEAIVHAAQTQQARERVQTLLDREEVKQQLLARGVDATQVQARLDALTESELQQLATHADQLPAGGDALGLAVFVFLVLLLTDILGYTDIFPFVKKPAR
jgi:hypothetical protein